MDDERVTPQTSTRHTLFISLACLRELRRRHVARRFLPVNNRAAVSSRRPAALLAIGLLISACELAVPASSASTSPALTTAPAASASTRASVPIATCLAPLQPTYLPWGTARAVERITNERGVEYVRYAGPAISGSSSAYFAIARAPADRLFPAPEPAVTPRNVAGRQVSIFRVGDPGVGEVTARWQEGADGCTYDAHLLLPSARGADEDELAKIVMSLYIR